jgi:hypothetical protein
MRWSRAAKMPRRNYRARVGWPTRMPAKRLAESNSALGALKPRYSTERAEFEPRSSGESEVLDKGGRFAIEATPGDGQRRGGA